MILSERQYNAAREKLEMLKASLEHPPASGVPQAVAAAAKAQMADLAEEVLGEITEYENTRARNPSEIPVASIQDLKLAPVRFRQAANMSAKDFGAMVGVSPRQIFRYESEGYRNCSVDVFEKIIATLNIDLTGRVRNTDHDNR